MCLAYQFDDVQLQNFIDGRRVIRAWKVFRKTKDGNLQSMRAPGESDIIYKLNNSAPVIPSNPKASIDEQGYHCFTTLKEAEVGRDLLVGVIYLVEIMPSDIVAFGTTYWLDGSTTHTLIVKTFVPLQLWESTEV